MTVWYAESKDERYSSSNLRSASVIVPRRRRSPKRSICDLDSSNARWSPNPSRMNAVRDPQAGSIPHAERYVLAPRAILSRVGLEALVRLTPPAQQSAQRSDRNRGLAVRRLPIG